MGSVLRILGGVALAFAGALAAAWSVIVAAVVPAATVTGLVMGGTGTPLMNVGPIATPDAATAGYLDWTKTKYILPSLRTGDGYSTDNSGSVAVYTPEEFWPQPNQQLTFNESVKYGLTNLTTCAGRQAGCVYNASADANGATPLANGPVDDDRYLVFGYSQSARIATNLKQSLVANYNLNGWDGVPAMDFVLIGNPNRPNGGILERFNGLSIPFVGINFDGATPTNSKQDGGGTYRFATTDFSGQYDGYSDFPMYPLNLLADLNALAGIATVHGSYFAFNTTKNDGTLDPNALINQGTYGDSQYYMIPTARLPILAIVENVIPDPVKGWVDPVFTLLDAPLRAVIETGYDRGISPGSPEPMRLIRLKPITDLLTIGYAVGVGIDNAASQIANNPGFRPLGTVKPAANSYGVTEISLSSLFGGSSPNQLGAPATARIALNSNDNKPDLPDGEGPKEGDPESGAKIDLAQVAGSGPTRINPRRSFEANFAGRNPFRSNPISATAATGQELDKTNTGGPTPPASEPDTTVAPPAGKRIWQHRMKPEAATATDSGPTAEAPAKTREDRRPVRPAPTPDKTETRAVQQDNTNPAPGQRQPRHDRHTDGNDAAKSPNQAGRHHVGKAA